MNFFSESGGELRNLFFETAQELLQALNEEGLELEKRPTDTEIVRTIRRTVHTLKGDSAACGLRELSELAHAMEDVLTPDLAVRTDGATAQLVLSAADVFDSMLAAYKANTPPPSGDGLRMLIDRLKTRPEAAAAQPFATRFEWTEYERLVIDSHASTQPRLNVAVQIDPQCPMPAAAIQLARNVLQDCGTPLVFHPEDASQNTDCIETVLATDKQPDWIERKCRIPAVTSAVYIQPYVGASSRPPAPPSLQASQPEPEWTPEMAAPEVGEPISLAAEADVFSGELPDLEQICGEELAALVAQNGDAPLPPIDLPSFEPAAAPDAEATSVLASQPIPEPPAPEETQPVAEPVETPAVAASVAPKAPAPVATSVAPAPATSPKSAPSAPAAAPTEEAAPERQVFTGSDTILRVDAERIDAVLNLVGELIIGKSMLHQAVTDFGRRFPKDPLRNKFTDTMSFQVQVLNELQRAVMKIRMVPVEQLFRRFPRVVRDIAHQENKQVELVMNGQDTDLDKSILDALAEPMSHLVRNAVDHGIEQPMERMAAGKPLPATVKLNAYHQGNHVVVEVSDDGRGIDPQRVLTKAIERGVVSAEAASRLTDSEILDLIFQPGFSTAERVTQVSGRGVGLDVVKTALERLKGSVTVKTEPGSGCTFLLKVPLTLAIIRALLFRVADKLYALPLSSVVEISRASKGEIHRVDGREVLRLRDEVLPVVRLRRLVPGCEEQQSGKAFVIVVAVGERKAGLIVDRLVGEEELVIKALDDQLVATKLVSGASILGDGTVVLVLNLVALVERLSKKQSGAWTPSSGGEELRSMGAQA